MTKFIFTIILFVFIFPLAANSQGRFEPPAEQGLQFGNVPVNEESVMLFSVIATPNNDILQNVQINYPRGAFTAQPVNFNIEAGQRVGITVTFTPDERDDFFAQARIIMGNPGGQLFVYEYPWRGTGVEAGEPEIEIDPERITLEIDNENRTDRESLWITNTGGEVLEVEFDEPGENWFTIDPVSFEIDPDERAECLINTTENYPENGEYESELVINTNDPDNEEVRVPVSLSVDFELENITRIVSLRAGWSLICSNVDFAEEFQGDQGPDIRLILDDIIESVLIIKDWRGRFCLPGDDFWGIPSWNIADGYLIKTNEETELELIGIPVPFDQDLEVVEGWNMIAYYPDYELTFEQIFADVVDMVDIAKNSGGDFYVPVWGYGGDTVVHPNEGIQLKASESFTLQYPEEPE